MSADIETLAIYDANAADYARIVVSKAEHQSLEAFVKDLPENAHVLDLGCGPGHYAAEMLKRGCSVDALDGSAAMVALASQIEGLNAAQALFDDLDAVDIYDGIWASFSLLHAPREKLPQHLGQIKRAIKARGVFHIGMKLGDSSSRDTLGRAYTYVSEGELLGLLTEAGLKPYDIFKGEGAGLSGSVDKFILVRAHG
ncbi:class I SAM-dependent DNA methyltransferase [Lentibacter sp. XHP0401]|jgi:SAM-dependent methyltransferase|uniref:class I SAM-dependent DNA methyltransferase n=1 Tax=Lentibacter sp. XHP0401 TaxID=2984334 RepID=UPI0021E92FC6|nr:class I SAM-dependent methyltransferase [Lentibacter sp. XHP0401]MCV2894204.1 class I SAM-dependent methyltransferase [Lentibacter sp. XHP0401]